MTRTLLILAAGAALASVTGVALAVPPDTKPAPPPRPATAPAKPTSPGKATARMKPVVVTYNMWGSISDVPGGGEGCATAAPGSLSLAPGAFSMDVAGGNRHARRLLAGAGVSVAGTDPVSIQTGEMTRITRATLPASSGDLKCGDQVRVSYRMAFRTTGRTTTGKPVMGGAAAMTLADLETKVARKVDASPAAPVTPAP